MLYMFIDNKKAKNVYFCKKLSCSECIKKLLSQHDCCGFCKKKVNNNDIISVPFLDDISPFFIKKIENLDYVEAIKFLAQKAGLSVPEDGQSKGLGDLKKRGVSIREGQTLRGLYDERSVLYEHYADIIIDPVGKNIPETVRLIKKKLKEVSKNDNSKGKSPDKGNSKTDISRKGKA